MTAHPVPRRTFLTATSAAVAGATLGNLLMPSSADAVAPFSSVGPPLAGDAPVKLGVASYSLRRRRLDRARAAIKVLRTPYVNFKSVHLAYERPPAELAAARKAIEADGFTIVGGGTIDFTKDTDDDVRRYFEYARAAGMPLIVGTCAPPVLPRVERFAKHYDIKV